MKCTCCFKPADRERDGSYFCAKCLAEIEELERPLPPREPVETLIIPGLATIKWYDR